MAILKLRKIKKSTTFSDLINFVFAKSIFLKNLIIFIFLENLGKDFKTNRKYVCKCLFFYEALLVV